MDEIFGMPLKVATDDDMKRLRRDGKRIVTGEAGVRMVSYYDRTTNEIFVSHILETAE